MCFLELTATPAISPTYRSAGILSTFCTSKGISGTVCCAESPAAMTLKAAAHKIFFTKSTLRPSATAIRFVEAQRGRRHTTPSAAKRASELMRRWIGQQHLQLQIERTASRQLSAGERPADSGSGEAT